MTLINLRSERVKDDSSWCTSVLWRKLLLREQFFVAGSANRRAATLPHKTVCCSRSAKGLVADTYLAPHACAEVGFLYMDKYKDLSRAKEYLKQAR